MFGFGERETMRKHISSCVQDYNTSQLLQDMFVCVYTSNVICNHISMYVLNVLKQNYSKKCKNFTILIVNLLKTTFNCWKK